YPTLFRSRGRTFRHPGLPLLVHLREIPHIRKPDRCRQELRLVGAGHGQQIVDLGKHLFGLRANIGCWVCRNLARKISNAIMDDDLAHTLVGFESLDSHGSSSLQDRSAPDGPARMNTIVAPIASTRMTLPLEFPATTARLPASTLKRYL